MEVHLVKQQEEHHWTSVVPGDERGVYSADPAELDRRNEVLKTLDQFTSDKMVSLTVPDRLEQSIYQQKSLKKL